MNNTKKLLEIFVIPSSGGHENVINRVLWAVDFEDAGTISTAYIETFLPVDNIQNFIPANQIGNTQLLQWVYEHQGGDAFFMHLQENHAAQIAYTKAREVGQRYFDGFDVPPAPSNPVTVTGAQTL